MTDKELQKVTEIITDIVQGDCDLCPCSFMLGDSQGCMRDHDKKSTCEETVKQKIIEILKTDREDKNHV